MKNSNKKNSNKKNSNKKNSNNNKDNNNKMEEEYESEIYKANTGANVLVSFSFDHENVLTHFEFVDRALNFHAAGAPNRYKMHAGHRVHLDAHHQDRNDCEVWTANRSTILCPHQTIHRSTRDAPRAQTF